jgi:drug/metabolite transporter (DMT)-like permease
VLLGLGIGGVIGNQVIFVLGLGRTSVAHAALAVAMTPIFVLTFATVSGQERLTGRKLLGMLVAATGIVALQFGREAGGRGPTLAGDLTVLLSGAIFAAYAVFGKSVASRFGTLTTNTFAYAGGGVLMLPVTWYLATQHDLSRVSAGAWLAVLYMAIFPAVIGYLIFYYALQRLPASRVSVFSYFQPVLATALAYLILGERPGPAFALSWGLVLTGVLLTERG